MVKKRKIKGYKGGGMDAGRDDFKTPSASATTKGSDHSHSRFEPGSGYYGEPVTNTGGNATTSNVTVPQKKPFQVNTGPMQLPNVGFLTMGFNALSRGLYNKKNLKEARKTDILGGEMLTTGQKKVAVPTGGDGGGQQQLCPDGSTPPCKTPATQIKAPAKKNMFLADFRSYDDGGEIVISSNVDKNLL